MSAKRDKCKGCGAIGDRPLVETKVAKTTSDSGAEGIHLETPTAKELQEAIEEAEVKGFSTVWIERPNRPQRAPSP